MTLIFIVILHSKKTFILADLFDLKSDNGYEEQL